MVFGIHRPPRNLIIDNESSFINSSKPGDSYVCQWTGSDIGLLHVQCQAITWTSDDLLQQQTPTIKLVWVGGRRWVYMSVCPCTDPSIHPVRLSEISLCAPWHHQSRINSSSPGQNGHHFAVCICNCIFRNENFSILTQISLTFVPKGLIDNKAALVQVMAWRRTGDKPLPKLMLTQFTCAYMRHWGEMS